MIKAEITVKGCQVFYAGRLCYVAESKAAALVYANALRFGHRKPRPLPVQRRKVFFP